MNFDNQNGKTKLGVWIYGVPGCDRALQEAGILDKCDIIDDGNLEQREKDIQTILKINSDDDCRAFLIGALGEIKTLQALLNLEGDFVILNDVRLAFDPPFRDRDRNEPVCTSQIDHVVVGTTGIFAIESKNWSADTYTRMMQADYDYSHIDQTRRAAKSLWLFIEREADVEYSLPVDAVLSLSGSARFKGNRRVRVVPSKNLHHYIAKPRTRYSLSVDEIKEIVYCLTDDWVGS